MDEPTTIVIRLHQWRAADDEPIMAMAACVPES